MNHLNGSIFRHIRTGELAKVSRINEPAGLVFLANPAGFERSITAGQLAALYRETEHPDDVATFPAVNAVFGAIRSTPELIRPFDSEPLQPLPDRRRFNHGSTRTLEKIT